MVWAGKRVSKDQVCNSEGKKLVEFCGENGLEMLNGKYGEDIKGEYTFINQVEKSVLVIC
jgi:hypothetical protein